MISSLPDVRHVGLEHRSDGKLALHIHYGETLCARDQALLLGALGAYVLNDQGPVFEPDFGKGGIVLLTPTLGQVLEYADFEKAARHFGCKLPDGDLPFVANGPCPIPEGTADGRPLMITDMPPLRH